MMRNLTCLAASAALLLTTAALGCTPDPGDVFDSLTSATATATMTQTGDGDGDPSETGTAEGDGDPSGDGDPTGCTPGSLGCECDESGMCDEGLTCDMDNMCSLGGTGDGDGDPTGGGDDPYDPNNCAPPSQALGIEGIEGNFCSAPCMSDADCPAGPAGTQPACALTLNDPMVPEFCALICSLAMDSCPAGSTCKDIMQMGAGICTYP